MAEELCKAMLEKRGIRETSCKTYLSALKKIYVATGRKGEPSDYEWLNNYDEVMKAINKEAKLSSKKNKITAVIVALSCGRKKPATEKLIDKYQLDLKKWNDTYFEELKEQKKTRTQSENWLDYPELIKVSNELMDKVKTFKKEPELTKKQFDTLQQLVLLRTHLEFPLRNDFARMPILKKTDYNKLTDEKKKGNFLVISSDGKKQFILNQYKNSKYLGEKKFDIPKELNKIINLWLKHNKSGWYLVKITEKDKPMNENMITKYFMKIFKSRGKRISSSMIRHIIISHMTRNEPTIKERQEKEKAIEDKFLHSSAVNALYRKVD